MASRTGTWLAGLTLGIAGTLALAQSDTTFTYQGQLQNAGQPVDADADFRFRLYDALVDGNQIGGELALDAIIVSDGLFDVALDFGADALSAQRWLEIDVRSPHDPGDIEPFTTLSPRQPLTPSPFSIQTRGIFVDADSKIGIGTTSPSARLEIRATEPDALFAATTSSTGRAVFGYAAAPTGNTYGVYGWSDSATGTGVKGFALDATGVNYGVYGQTNSPNGYAGYFTGGRNYFQGRVGIGTDLPNYSLDILSADIFAVKAETSSTSDAARAVFGIARNGGTTTGVYGSSTSTTGRGVYGLGSSTSGVNYGVYGQTRSLSGRGVYGEAINPNGGVSYGVVGESESTNGRGVYGKVNASTGITYGVLGEVHSTGGRAVSGRALATSGTNYGVYGESNSTSGRGVYGEASASSGTTFGVLGVSNSTSGRGVRGTTSATTGFTYAVEGRAASTNGRGVWGYATASSGFNIGVLGKSNSAGGWDFYADGVGGNYGTGSSIRWKNNITNIDNPLDKLARLRGVYFDWDTDHGGQHDVGMIAEEVGKVLPEIVNYEENGIDAIGMDYSKLTPLLVEAVNALRAETDKRQLLTSERIASAERKNALLRAENESLSTRLAQLEQVVTSLVGQKQKESR